MKFLLFMCAVAQLVSAQSGSTGTTSNTKKQDCTQGSVFSGGGSILTSGKKQDVIFHGGDQIITGKKSDIASDTGGGSTAVGSTMDPLGKKKDFAMTGEPIKIGDPKKRDYCSSDSGGNGQVISNGGLKRDYHETGGTGVSAGTTGTGIGKKSDFYRC